MSAKFVLKPEDLSVVVASNLNADILSDLGSALAGSLGLAASANINLERRFPSMFEPVHGSAPDIAGQGISNPVGTISSGALMLRHFGLDAEADRLEDVIAEVTGAGVKTRDIGGTATTDEVTDAIVAALQKSPAARLSRTPVGSDRRTVGPDPAPAALLIGPPRPLPGLLDQLGSRDRRHQVATFHNEVGIMHAHPDAPACAPIGQETALPSPVLLGPGRASWPASWSAGLPPASPWRWSRWAPRSSPR